MQKRPDDDIPPSATDEPVFEIGPSALELTWEKHKTSILVGGGAVIVAVIAFFGTMAVTHANKGAAMDALSLAVSPAEYRAVIDNYPGSVVSGNASLLLATALRDDDKPDEARAVLDQFLQSQPQHPLAPLALVGLAGLATDPADAKANLQRILDEYPSSFAAPYAMFSEAEDALATGDRQAALEGFQRLSRQHPSSVGAAAGQGTLMALESLVSGISVPAEPVTAEALDATEPPAEEMPTMDQVIDEDSDPGI